MMVRMRPSETPQTRPDTRPGESRAQRPPGPWARRLLLAGVLAAAFNLRPAVTSLGPLLQEVRADLHMSGTTAGLLTSVPPLCFAVFGTAAPRLARRFGPGAVVGAGTAAIAAGLLLRPLAGSTAPFLAATALGLAGIAVGNVLMPVLVKRHFPDRVGAMTGLYSMFLSLGTAVAAAVTVPAAHALGGNWRYGLGMWGVAAALAVLPWLVPSRERPASAGTAGAGPVPALRITRSPTAWALAVFFGVQAAGAYITMGWLPQIFRDAGVSAGTAGLLLAITMVVSVPLSFALPALAGRMRHQGGLVAVLGAFGLAGCTGLLLAPAAAPLVWALLLGVSNAAFPLALTMIGLRSRSSAGVVRLSAFAQSTGYLISIPGPILVGALYQHTGGWTAPIMLMGALLLPQTAAGMLAGRDRRVEDEV